MGGLWPGRLSIVGLKPDLRLKGSPWGTPISQAYPAVPNKAPTPAVIAIASAPQKVTRQVP